MASRELRCCLSTIGGLDLWTSPHLPQLVPHEAKSVEHLRVDHEQLLVWVAHHQRKVHLAPRVPAHMRSPSSFQFLSTQRRKADHRRRKEIRARARAVTHSGNKPGHCTCWVFCWCVPVRRLAERQGRGQAVGISRCLGVLVFLAETLAPVVLPVQQHAAVGSVDKVHGGLTPDVRGEIVTRGRGSLPPHAHTPASTHTCACASTSMPFQAAPPCPYFD